MEVGGAAQEAKAEGAVGFDIEKHVFVIPTKKIDDPATHEKFKKSEACNELLGFIGMASAAVKNS